EMLAAQLAYMADRLEKDGHEVDASRLKKVAKIRRAVELIKSYCNDDYIEKAEQQLNYTVSHYPLEFEPYTGSFHDPDMNREDLFVLVEKRTTEEIERDQKIFELSNKIADEEWNELWDIIKGQGNYDPTIHGDFDEWYDGSD